MVLGTHVDTDLVEPTLARDEDVSSRARLSDEEAEAVLDAYSAAVVAVAERVGPSVVNIAIEKDVTAQGPGGQRVYTVPGGGSGVVIAPDGSFHAGSGATYIDGKASQGHMQGQIVGDACGYQFEADNVGSF